MDLMELRVLQAAYECSGRGNAGDAYATSSTVHKLLSSPSRIIMGGPERRVEIEASH